ADEALAIRGELYLRNRNPESALQDLLTVAGRQPANAQVYPLLAEAYLQIDQSKEAIAALKRGQSLSPGSLQLLRRIVEVHGAFGAPAGASRATEDFLTRNPDSVDGRALQVRLAIRRKDWTSAETALIRLRENPEAQRLGMQLEAEFAEGQRRYADATAI